jgi:predicted phosphate transport protein (TIGR00153 family)
VPKELEEGFRELMSRTLATVEMYELLVDTLSELLESSFGKKDVEETLELVVKVEEMEHQVDLIEKQLMKIIFEKEELLGGGGVYFFVELTKNMGRIADRTESAADRLRTMVLRR